MNDHVLHRHVARDELDVLDFARVVVGLPRCVSRLLGLFGAASRAVWLEHQVMISNLLEVAVSRAAQVTMNIITRDPLATVFLVI